MTEAEKKEIVALVMSEISGQAVDFDLQTVTPQRTDILPAVRPDGEGGYTGVTLDWGGITDELTTQAKEFRNEALQAKKDTELLKGETNGIKSNVEDIYRQFNEAVDKTIESVRNVYQSDLNAESTARQTADNTLQQNIDSEASTRAEADTAIGARIDSEVTTRESEVAELERVNAIQKYEIENLKAKAEGQIYRTEIVEGEAYSLDVPSSVSPYAEVQRIGGKSVVWNQIYKATHSTVGLGVSVNNSNGEVTITGTSTGTGNGGNFNFTEFKGAQGHKFYFKHNLNLPSGWYIFDQYNLSSSVDLTSLVFEQKSPYIIPQLKVASSNTTVNTTGYLQLIDLTKMFGSGNEPTLEECKKIFSDDYYPYDAGTIRSFPVQRVKSVGKNLFPVLTNEKLTLLKKPSSGNRYVYVFDVKEPPYVIKSYSDTVNINSFVGKVDDTNTYQVYTSIRLTTGENNTVKITSEGKYCIYVGGDTSSDCLKLNEQKIQIEKGSTATAYSPYKESTLDLSSVTTDLKSALNVHDEWSNGKKIIRVGERAYTSGDESESNYITDGKTTYYPIDTPTEETVPEIDNYIQVEGGGTLTFESDETVKMPVPSTTRFVVDLT